MSHYNEDVVNKWLSSSSTFQNLTNSVPQTSYTTMIKNSIYPSLLKTKKSFILPTEQIKDGLHLKVELDPITGETKTTVIKFDDGNHPTIIQSFEGDQSLPIIEAFILNFPDAIVATEEMRPLHIIEENKTSLGYLSLNTILQLSELGKTKVRIGVP